MIPLINWRKNQIKSMILIEKSWENSRNVALEGDPWVPPGAYSI